MNFRLAIHYLDFVTKNEISSADGDSRKLEAFSFSGLLFHGLGCGKFTISVRFEAPVFSLQGSLIAAPQIVQGTESICFPVSSLVFTATRAAKTISAGFIQRILRQLGERQKLALTLASAVGG